jgi:hypothetical protein
MNTGGKRDVPLSNIHQSFKHWPAKAEWGNNAAGGIDE